MQPTKEALVIKIGAEIEQPGRAIERRCQALSRHRPAGHRQPGAPLEVDFVEARAFADPGMRAAAQPPVAQLEGRNVIQPCEAAVIAPPGAFDAVSGNGCADIDDGIQGLLRGVEIGATAFDDEHPAAAAGKFPGDRQADGAAADDRHIRTKLCACGD
ncbi:hypothetical protein D3C86_1738510 [compost metagenome]